jgi:sugar diacid utilization regulator
MYPNAPPLSHTLLALLADIELNLHASDDLHEHAQGVIDLWFAALLSGTGIDEAGLRQLADIGRHWARQGDSLSVLTRSLGLGMRRMWQVLLEAAQRDGDIRDEALFSLSPYLYGFLDQVSQEISVAYLDEHSPREHWRAARGQELTRLILDDPPDENRFKRICETLGIDPAGARVALAMDVEMSEALPCHRQNRLDRLLPTIARHIKANGNDLLHALHRGRLITWVPVTRGHSMVCTDLTMREAARNMVTLVPQVHAIGVGLVDRGAAGWAASAEEAIKAIDAGRHDTQGDRWFMYSDIALSAGVLRPDSLMRYLDSLIERLTYESDLLPTLVAYFNHGQHRKLAAGALGIHPNTLNYRLERIEETLGADLNHSGWIARLDVALTLRRLSGPAQVHAPGKNAKPMLAAGHSR